MGERERIGRAIAAMEAQRTTLGHGVVDTMVAMAREKLHALARAQAALQRKQVTVLFADVSGFVEEGLYRLVGYAWDDDGNLSLPREATAMVGEWWVYLPLVVR